MLDQTTLEIIKAKPIGKGLDAFHSTFRSIAEELDISASLNVLDKIGSEGNYS
jgi:hypothetical protein